MRNVRFTYKRFLCSSVDFKVQWNLLKTCTKRVDVSTDLPHAELDSLQSGTLRLDLVLTVLKSSKHIFEQISETVKLRRWTWWPRTNVNSQLDSLQIRTSTRRQRQNVEDTYSWRPTAQEYEQKQSRPSGRVSKWENRLTDRPISRNDGDKWNFRDSVGKV